MSSEAIESVRYVPGKNLVRDLCLREKDFHQVNRMWYLTYLRDAWVKLQIKTQMITTRVALPVIRGTVPYVEAPAEMLDVSSISAENRHGVLETMIINTKIRTGIADLTLIHQCGCACGCKNEVCSSVRNFETIYGTMDMQLPDGSMKTFKTLYRKIVLKDGSYVEQRTVPTKVFVNNVHTDTRLNTQETTLCKLEIEECGCLKDCEHNVKEIQHHCKAIDYKTECGCAVRHPHNVERDSFNMEEDGSRIYLSSNFRPDFVVLRHYALPKTKDIIFPFLAREAAFSTIKELSTDFDPKASAGDKQFWRGKAFNDRRELNDALYPVSISNFYAKQFGK